MEMVKATNQSRALYDQLKRLNPGAIITDSYLLFLKTLQGTITTVSFDVLNNVGTPQVIEQRLNITDKFAVRDMAFCLFRSVTTTTAVPTAAQLVTGKPYTWNNPLVFTAANEALGLEAVYNGWARIVIDSVVYYQNLDLRRFFRVPTTQQGTLVFTASNSSADGWDSLNYGFAPVYPTFSFNGIGKNEVTVTLPNPTATSAASGFSNQLACYCRGFLIQNVNQGR